MIRSEIFRRTAEKRSFIAMGNKNTAIQFLKDKGFYIALAVCIVGAAAVAQAAPPPTMQTPRAM